MEVYGVFKVFFGSVVDFLREKEKSEFFGVFWCFLLILGVFWCFLYVLVFSGGF